MSIERHADRLAAIIDAIALPVLVGTPDGPLELVNEAACELLGWPLEEIIGRSTTELGIWADPATRDEMRAKVARDGAVLAQPVRVVRRDGTIVDTLGSLRLLSVGDWRCTVAVVVDVTERVQAEEALRRSEARFRLLIDSIDEAFLLGTYQPDSVQYVSPAFEGVYGVTRRELYADPTLGMQLVHPDDREEVTAAILASLDGERREVEHRIVRRDGTTRWVRLRCALAADTDDLGHRMYMAVMEDITVRKTAEADLLRAHDEAERANQAKTELLSRMSHELRTPLNAILGFGQLLEMEELTSDQRQSLEQVVGAGRHLLGLVDQVLDISRAETGTLDMRPGTVEVCPLVAEVLAALADAALVAEVALIAPPDSGAWLWGDQALLRTALRELVANAIAFNRKGGTVTVEVTNPEPGMVRVSVVDSGPGLTALELDEAFDTFLSIRPGDRASGSGLGLARARRLVEAMGGHLRGSSEPGRGSVFWLDLPASGRAPDEPVAGTGSATRRVMYIEDNESNAELLARLFRDRPAVRLQVERDGASGLAAVRADPPHLLLLDLHLPDMSGEEILHALMQDPATQHVPVVVVSADASRGTVERALALGAREFLTKPFTIAGIMHAVDRLLGPEPGSDADGEHVPDHGDDESSGDEPADEHDPLPPLTLVTTGTQPDDDAHAGGTVLDEAMIRSLEELDELHPGTLAELVHLFLATTEERLVHLDEAMAGTDDERLGAVVHTIMGTITNLGARQVAVACSRVEERLRAGDSAGARAAVPAIRTAYEAARQALVERMERSGG